MSKWSKAFLLLSNLSLLLALGFIIYKYYLPYNYLDYMSQEQRSMTSLVLPEGTTNENFEPVFIASLYISDSRNSSTAELEMLNLHLPEGVHIILPYTALKKGDVMNKNAHTMIKIRTTSIEDQKDDFDLLYDDTESHNVDIINSINFKQHEGIFLDDDAIYNLSNELIHYICTKVSNMKVLVTSEEAREKLETICSDMDLEIVTTDIIIQDQQDKQEINDLLNLHLKNNGVIFLQDPSNLYIVNTWLTKQGISLAN